MVLSKINEFTYRQVTMIDIDPDALNIASFNISSLNLNNIQLINADVFSLPKTFYKKFDVFTKFLCKIVLTNPPFGIRSNKSADVDFLKKAVNVRRL